MYISFFFLFSLFSLILLHEDISLSGYSKIPFKIKFMYVCIRQGLVWNNCLVVWKTSIQVYPPQKLIRENTVKTLENITLSFMGHCRSFLWFKSLFILILFYFVKTFIITIILRFIWYHVTPLQYLPLLNRMQVHMTTVIAEISL